MDIEQGSIFAIPLEKNLGYAFVKCVFIQGAGGSSNLTLKILDMRSEAFAKKSSGKIEEADELCYRLLMMGRPSVRGKNKWHYLGTQSLTSEEANEVPSFKQLSGPMLDLIDEKDWSKLNWSVILNFSLMNQVDSLPYASIRHLGPWMHSSDLDITIRLTMIWLKKLGYDIRSFYNTEELDSPKNVWNKIAYNEAMNIEFYSEVERKFRGKIIS
ncbi:hypothetical protein [Flaviaesturariibacter amylovorans]|uniref:Uncharacterized protein n=1 Tax=Flaviaesturariibacter amylovorans TaxID=1084520 RepID=A0ABP8GB30_9BACT